MGSGSLAAMAIMEAEYNEPRGGKRGSARGGRRAPWGARHVFSLWKASEPVQLL